MHKNFLRNIDLWLLVPVLILVTLSLVTLFSLNINFFYGQFALFILSFVFYIIFSQTNYLILKIYAKRIYVASFVVLFAVLLIGIESRGAVRWVEIFGFRLQFSEVLKPFLAISFASYIASVKTLNIKGFLNVFLLLFPIAFLIFLQPDLGNAIIYFIIVLLTLIYLGFPFRYFLISFLPFLLSVPFLWRFLHDYQRQRIISFVFPYDVLGGSWSQNQTKISIGSGQIFGQGLGQGSQVQFGFLPEPHTDFIFSVIAEEWGMIGSVVLFSLYGFLVWRVLKIAIYSHSNFPRLFASGYAIILMTQFFINIGMNLSLLPVVGIYLPFISYGGSGLIGNFIALGILQSIKVQRT